MDQASAHQVIDQLAEMLAVRRRDRVTRHAAYIALARAILADEPVATQVDQTIRAA